ncbi:hypothetical protein MASR2M15_27900 [Anaerolineales bacterium]
MVRIVVIEDEFALLEEIVDILRYEAFDVEGASTGLEGIDLIYTFAPDIIISDVMLPDIDGFEIVERVRSDPKIAHTQIILLTALTGRNSMVEGMSKGADDFLNKPFERHELFEAIQARLVRIGILKTKEEEFIHEVHQILMDHVQLRMKDSFADVQLTKKIIQKRMQNLEEHHLNEILDHMNAAGQTLRYIIEQIVMLIELESDLLNRKIIREIGRVADFRDLVSGGIYLLEQIVSGYREVYLEDRPFEYPLPIRCEMNSLKHGIMEITQLLSSLQQIPALIDLQTFREDDMAVVRISTRLSQEAQDIIERELSDTSSLGKSIGSSLIHKIIEAHSGVLDFMFDGDYVIIVVRIPLVLDVSSP